MSLKNYLTLALICISMSFLIKMNSVEAKEIDCIGGFTNGPVPKTNKAECAKDPEQRDLHLCDPKKCGHNNAHFVSWKNCQSYNPPSKKIITVNCVSYQYKDPEHYLCWDSKDDLFLCSHKLNDKPVISCDC
ncbi:secreted protein [Melampsora americana]|nr:secreted protein [Melampsora americana]